MLTGWSGGGPVIGVRAHAAGCGLAVEPGATVTFARALAAVGVGEPDRVYWAGRATLVRRPEDIDDYERCFDTLFGFDGTARRSRPSGGATKSSSRTTSPGRAAGRAVADPRPRRSGAPGPVQPGRGAAPPRLRDLQPGRARRGPPAHGRPALRRRAAPIATGAALASRPWPSGASAHGAPVAAYRR